MLQYHSPNCRGSIHTCFFLFFFFYLLQIALMINSSPQHIYSWVYYTWFLFVANAFPQVLCDALAPTLLAQMAFLSPSYYQASSNHTHVRIYVHTYGFLHWIIWLLLFRFFISISRNQFIVSGMLCFSVHTYTSLDVSMGRDTTLTKC